MNVYNYFIQNHNTKKKKNKTSIGQAAVEIRPVDFV